MAEKANSAALPDILVVGIAGGSGGGKTTLTTNLIRRFGDKVCIVHHDNYYRAHDDLTYEERTRLNYDCPEAFETEMMIEHLRLLKQGRSIHCPVYDFKVHNRSGETIEIEPRPVILVEGILIFAEPALSNLMDIRVFVDADADVRLARRVLRDTEKRGRTVRSVVEQWQNTVKPMHEKYVEPSKKNADIIVPQGGKNPVALDLIVGRIQRHLDENAEGKSLSLYKGGSFCGFGLTRADMFRRAEQDPAPTLDGRSRAPPLQKIETVPGTKPQAKKPPLFQTEEGRSAVRITAGRACRKRRAHTEESGGNTRTR